MMLRNKYTFTTTLPVYANTEEEAFLRLQTWFLQGSCLERYRWVLLSTEPVTQEAEKEK